LKTERIRDRKEDGAELVLERKREKRGEEMFAEEVIVTVNCKGIAGRE
jgi:hypothetical protein